MEIMRVLKTPLSPPPPPLQHFAPQRDLSYVFYHCANKIAQQINILFYRQPYCARRKKEEAQKSKGLFSMGNVPGGNIFVTSKITGRGEIKGNKILHFFHFLSFLLYCMWSDAWYSQLSYFKTCHWTVNYTYNCLAFSLSVCDSHIVWTLHLISFTLCVYF